MKKRMFVYVLMMSLIFLNAHTFADDLDDVMFFSAHDPEHGEELWRSDGTEAGTVIVKDIWPGKESSKAYVAGKAGNTVFIIADDGVHGRGLWKSDGTDQGTMMIKDTFPKENRPYFGSFNTYRNLLFYSVHHNIEDTDVLWRSDGTAEGTYRIKKGIGVTYRMKMISFKNAVYFFADEYNPKFIKSDGTEEGTTILKEFKRTSSNWIFKNKNQLLFFANDGVHGEELWTSDGTREGCAMVKDILPGNLGSGGSRNHTYYNGYLYFDAYDSEKKVQLWRSDGTEEGTTLVKNISPGGLNDFERMCSITTFNGQLYFSVWEEPSDISTLWKSDGTEEGTAVIKPIEANNFFKLNNQLYFYNYSSLWQTDGTEKGTIKMFDRALSYQRDSKLQIRCHSLLNDKLYSQVFEKKLHHFLNRWQGFCYAAFFTSTGIGSSN